MAEVLFSPNGTPSMAFGSNFMASTSGFSTDNSKHKKPTTTDRDPDDKISIEGKELVEWFAGNRFPQDAEDVIGRTGVLNTGLAFIQKFTLGQGVFPCRVTGYDAEGNEILEVLDDERVTTFLTSRMVRRYMANACRDYLKFGVAFPELVMNEDGSQIVGIEEKNALFSRFLRKVNGVIPGVVVSGKWPNNPADKKDYNIIDLLDPYDPFADLDARRIAKKVKGKNFIYPLRNEWSNNEYYSLPMWYPAHKAGWTKIAEQVPQFLMKMYDNQVSFKWHIKIPYAYWDRRFPEEKYKDLDERQAAIQQEMDNIEANLTGAENAQKALFTMFAVGPNGKAEEQWEIENLHDKNKSQENLVTSAAANSEILFALMINPNVFGAGMPGGTYAGNQGGSNIREAFLVNIALSWLDRQNLLDPLELILEYNGINNVELRFRNTILTTLDTGAGTQQTLS